MPQSTLFLTSLLASAMLATAAAAHAPSDPEPPANPPAK